MTTLPTISRDGLVRHEGQVVARLTRDQFDMTWHVEGIGRLAGLATATDTKRQAREHVAHWIEMDDRDVSGIGRRMRMSPVEVLRQADGTWTP